jgi:serine/threonine-protein kinase
MKGRRLGPYELGDQLGAGGMGEVWLAQDTRLGRQVAVKVLPGDFASDPERLARFEQEARAAAALNHPHIAAVHDVGVDDGVHYMVQEYLQGQPLREALEKGAVPLKKSLALGTEIAEALRAAHKAGIVHRDLKPENIFVTEDGHAKVLDFGLAKLTEVARGPLSSESMSPTELLTDTGSVMGTAGYMAPEQVRGEDVDPRADLFSLGCILWEMVTGRRAFAGKSVPHTLHKILDEEPEGSEIGDGGVPLRLRWVLQKALAKDREARTQSAGDLVVDLRQVAAEVESGTALLDPGVVPVSDEAPATVETGIRPALAIPAAVLLVAVAAIATWALLRTGTSVDRDVSRFEIQVTDSELDVGLGASVILSPDGRTLVYADRDGAWRRPLDELEPKPVVEGAVDNVVFSPDGQWIAYEQNETLWRVLAAGGSRQEVAKAMNDRGTYWGEAGTILLAPNRFGPIMRVRVDDGGEPEPPEPVTELEGDEITHRWPQLLPDGRAVLYTAHVNTAGFDNANIVVRDLNTLERRVLLRGGSYARYAPTGHLVYATGGALFAVPFDIERLEVTGTSVPILENLQTDRHGGAQYDFSDDGTLVYLRAGDDATAPSRSWAFVARDGSIAQEWPTSGFSWGSALSPKGDRLAATVNDDAGTGLGDLWIWERERAAPRRITFDEANDIHPTWLPGGKELIYASNDDGTYRLYRVRADGSGGREPLPDPYESESEVPQAISSDGRWLLTKTLGPRELRVRDLTGEEAPRLIGNTAGFVSEADLSPDAGWVAYTSDESGDWEVYAVPFLAGNAEKVTVSVGGGGMPSWSDDGRSIYYRSAEGVMVVDLEIVDGELRPGDPRALFEGDFDGTVVGFPFRGHGLLSFDAAGDGETFVLSRSDAGARQTTATIVFNWFEELERLVPTGR